MTQASVDVTNGNFLLHGVNSGRLAPVMPSAGIDASSETSLRDLS